MTSNYSEKLEQIITDMKADSPENNQEYLLWLDFLRKVKPESELLVADSGGEVKEYTDVREIMLLAENNQYPIWYIQPFFDGACASLIYKAGELQTETPDDRGVPKIISGFAGTIFGSLSDDNLTFVASDVSSNLGFVQKMEFLKSSGFTIPEYVLFPTDKITTISSSKLETSLNNFISKAGESGSKVEGVVIASDAPLILGDNTNSFRIIFKPIHV